MPRLALSPDGPPTSLPASPPVTAHVIPRPECPSGSSGGLPKASTNRQLLLVRTAAGTGYIILQMSTLDPNWRVGGCEWLHVDFDDELRAFYLDACGFEPAAAGVIRL